MQVPSSHSCYYNLSEGLTQCSFNLAGHLLPNQPSQLTLRMGELTSPSSLVSRGLHFQLSCRDLDGRVEAAAAVFDEIPPFFVFAIKWRQRKKTWLFRISLCRGFEGIVKTKRNCDEFQLPSHRRDAGNKIPKFLGHVRKQSIRLSCFVFKGLFSKSGAALTFVGRLIESVQSSPVT